MPGDASTRVYHRITTDQNTYVLMQMESFSEIGRTAPFLEVQEHLSQCGISVPKVFFKSGKDGLILLQDLGDVTFLRRLQGVSDPQLERKWYQKIIDQLINMQIKCSPEKSPGKKLCAFEMRFDEEKLNWETDFAIENFYQGYLSRNIVESDLRIMKNTFSEINRILSNEPTYFTHRDLHSRNIMITPEDEVIFIDFQDARLGPLQYDLVSLLRDCYYQLDETQVQSLVDYFIIRFSAISGTQIDREHFFRIFDLMTVQRSFKAIGSFASFWQKRKNPGYLKFIGNTFENIRRTLLRYPEYSELRELLFHYYYF
jgi:aminoglycoside/choline kinase family phosphotransferase